MIRPDISDKPPTNETSTNETTTIAYKAQNLADGYELCYMKFEDWREREPLFLAFSTTVLGWWGYISRVVGKTTYLLFESGKVR